MNLFCQSVNFGDCPAETRNQLILDRRRQDDFLHTFRNCPQISDALILNTCNRLEFYFYARKTFDIFSYANDFISADRWNAYQRTFVGIDVVEHLFRVAAGLESQIIGENEIFAQLKAAYSFALRCGCVNSMFHRLLHSAFRVAKAVRTYTNISAGALSIAQAAVELAEDNIMLEKAIIIVVGSGANAELIVRHLIRKNAQDFTVVARNLSAAALLIERTNGCFLPLNELQTAVSRADIVFTASASQEPLIKADTLEKGIKPLLLIDLSVPPNIERQVGNIPGIKLFNIDSLGEIPKAEAIINEHLRVFNHWWSSLSFMPQIAQKVYE